MFVLVRANSKISLISTKMHRACDGNRPLFAIAAMLVFKLSCKLAMCYAGGQTLEKRQIVENRLVEILK